MKTLTKETWQMVRQNLGNVLLFELLYRGIFFPVYLRLANRILRWSLTMAGYSYLTASNFGDFLVQPWTIPVLLLISIAGLLLILLESAGLVTAFWGSACEHKLTPFHIFRDGLQKTAKEIYRKNWRLCLVLAAHFFVVNLLPMARYLSHIRPLNFVIKEMLGIGWVLWAAFFFLVVCILFSLPGVFTGYGCMGNRQKYMQAQKSSQHIVREHGRQIVVFLVLCNLAIALVVVAVYLLAVFAAAVSVVVYAQRTLAMAVLLMVTEKIERGMLFLGGIFLIVTDFGALGAMYCFYGNSVYPRKKHYSRRLSEHPAVKKRMVAIASMIAAAALLCIFDMVSHGFAISDEIFFETQITAHRGSSKRAPENTIAAIEAAVEDMADFVELDVQMTKDGVAVLGHDATLKRVAGLNQTIASMTWEELQRLEVGGWFSPEYTGEPIPRLEQVMELCKGKINLNIEVKNVGKDSRLPEMVAEMIREWGMEDQCVVSSTSLSYLERMKSLAPELRTGYILSAAYGDLYFNEIVDFISIRASFVDRQVVERAHERGMGVHVWTVNSKSEMERLRMLGADNLITDYPVLAREIIYREEATETLVEYLEMVFR